MSANTFFWDIPTKIAFGAGAIKDIRKSEIRDILPGNKVFLVTSSGNSLRSAGVIKDVVHIFENAELEVVIYDGITSNPGIDEVKEGIDLLQDSEADFVAARYCRRRIA